MKIKLTISYDGSQFYGSAIQPDKKTVHSKLLEVFGKLGIEQKLDMSGRTDKDVHAFRQVISFNAPKHWEDTNKLKDILNKMLPNSIRVRSAKIASEDFHARFSARKREYRYLFTNKTLTPFSANYITYYKDINEERINEAIKLFVGKHDFEFFSKNGSEPVSTIREVFDIKLYKHKDIYVLKFKANAYLRSQIRMMVDFIMKISAGKLNCEDLKKQLYKEKLISWTLADPYGLYLSRISYE